MSVCVCVCARACVCMHVCVCMCSHSLELMKSVKQRNNLTVLYQKKKIMDIEENRLIFNMSTLSRVILCLKVRESCLLYINIYIACVIS